MIFQAARDPQYPQVCRLPSASAKAARRRLGESVSRQAAEQACSKWNEKERAASVFDVLSSGDLEMAHAGGY